MWLGVDEGRLADLTEIGTVGGAADSLQDAADGGDNDRGDEEEGIEKHGPKNGAGE